MNSHNWWSKTRCDDPTTRFCKICNREEWFPTRKKGVGIIIFVCELPKYLAELQQVLAAEDFRFSNPHSFRLHKILQLCTLLVSLSQAYLSESTATSWFRSKSFHGSWRDEASEELLQLPIQYMRSVSTKWHLYAISHAYLNHHVSFKILEWKHCCNFLLQVEVLSMAAEIWSIQRASAAANMHLFASVY